MKAELFETELTASTLIIFCPLAGFKVIQRDLLGALPGHGRLVSVPSRGSRLSNASRLSSLRSPRSSFRPLAGFKVIQLNHLDTRKRPVERVSVPSRGSRLSNQLDDEVRRAQGQFPSPRGVQGYPTRRPWRSTRHGGQFPSPRGVQGYPTNRHLPALSTD